MSGANGYFEAFVNGHSSRPSADDRSLVEIVGRVVRAGLQGSQVRWAGSQRKGTAVEGSDLDLCVESSEPVTERQRRALRADLQRELGREVQVLSHALRVARFEGRPKVDVAFANAAFGSRPLPEPSEFHDRRARQTAVRAMKLWARWSRLPHLPGWSVEAVVVHLDQGPAERLPLELFLRLLDWLERATPSAVEAVLRPAAHPRWDAAWSDRLPGRLEAVSNQARALRSRDPTPERWQSPDDVGRWLGR